MLQIYLSGASGKMGQALFKAISDAADCNVVDVKSNASVVIDFSNKVATAKVLDFCKVNKLPLVIGTTGLDAADVKAITNAANNIPIVLSPNMSLGINMFLKFINSVTKNLAANWQVTIEERHHQHKLDNISGTALYLQSILAEKLNLPKKSINIVSERQGNIAGTHKIKFFNANESLHLEHTATDRSCYALGALAAAKWIINKKSGIYDMLDVLEF